MTSAPSSLSSSARRALRAAAHHLDPVVMVGQHGLTPAVLHEIDLALTAHALIKVRVQSDERETREAYLANITQKLDCESVQHLGKLLVLWRNSVDSDDKDVDVDQNAATTIKAAKSGRGPRSKLASENKIRANDAAPRSGRGYDHSNHGGYGGRDGDSRRREGFSGGNAGHGNYGAGRSGSGGSYRNNEPAQREGWAPRDRRGATRSENRDERFDNRSSNRSSSFSGGRSGAENSGFDNRGGPRGRSGFNNNDKRDSQERPPRGGGFNGQDDRRSDRDSGRNSSGFRSQQSGDREPSTKALRSRWDEHRDNNRSTSSNNSGFGGNRDSFSGKPRGFSRGSNTRGNASNSGGFSSGTAAKPRTRRRMG